MSAYSELFVYDAMETLGEAFEYVVNNLKLCGQEFLDTFSQGHIGDMFSKGDIRYTVGMSGIELANVVLKEYPIIQECKNYELSIGYPPEYWCGWILAYYQWYLGETFLEICQRISYKNLMNLYGVLHEADISKAVSVLNDFVKKT